MSDNANLKENYTPKKKKRSEMIQHFADGGDVIPDSQFKADPEQSTAQQPPVTQLAPTNGSLPPDSIPDNQFVADEDKYSTPGQMAKTAVEGFGRGVAGPLMDLAEVKSGLVKPEDIRARAEANPGIHAASELGGFVGSMMTGVGEGALIAKTGLKALEGAKALGIGVDGAGIASQIGAKALQGATEMGLLSSGDEISKMITEDPNQSMQTAATAVGLNMLLGGIGGGAIGAISPLWKATSASKLGDIAADAKGRLQQRLANSDRLEALSGELDVFHKEIKGLGDEVYGTNGLKSSALDKAMPEMNDNIANQSLNLSTKIEDTIAKMEAKPNSYPARLVANLKEHLNDYSQAVSKPEITPGEIFDATQDLKQTMQGYAKFEKRITSLDESYKFVQAARDLSHELRTSLEDSKVWGEAGHIQQKLNNGFAELAGKQGPLAQFESKFTSNLNGDQVIDQGKVSTFLGQLNKPNASIKKDILQNFIEAGQKYKNSFNDVHLGFNGEAPLAPSSLNTVNQVLEKSTPGTKIADYIMDKLGATVGGHALGSTLGGAAGGALGHPALGAYLGSQSLGKFFESILPSLVKPLLTNEASGVGLKAAADYGQAVIKGENLISKASKAIFKSGAEVLPESALPTETDRDKLTKMLDEYQANPDKLLLINNNVGHYLPDHGTAQSATAVKAVNYLNSIRPDVQPKGPLDTKIPPGKWQKSAFNQALDLAQQPLLILQQIKDGTVTTTSIQHVQSMYPQLYAKLGQKLLSEMTIHLSNGEAVPYKTRLGLSMFSAQPLDSTMIPSSIQAAQSNSSASQQQPPQGGADQGSPAKHSTSGLNKLPGTFMTSNQARQQARSSRTD